MENAENGRLGASYNDEKQSESKVSQMPSHLHECRSSIRRIVLEEGKLR